MHQEIRTVPSVTGAHQCTALQSLWKTIIGASCAMEIFALMGLMGASPSYALGPNAMRSGFDANTLPANDDGSTGLVSIGATINFFGINYSQLYVNNNGNVTFDDPLSTYTPFNLTSTGQVIIAPFFADVDTRVGNVVTYGTGTVNGRPAFGVNWPGVGCYNQITSVLNYFQVLLIDRSDIAAEDFDIEFNYNQIQWETGTASGGDTNCQGSNAARVGFSNGTGAPGTFFELPGSATPGAFLASNSGAGLIHNSLNSSQLGRYLFSVRNGTPEFCGNEIVEGTEECDDGNTVDGGGCSAQCTIEEAPCGNGTVEGDEECDDGNTAGGDCCSASCTWEYNFSGFFSPIDNLPVVNQAKAGQGIPIKWRLTSCEDDTPISDPTSFVSVTSVGDTCGSSDPTDLIETYTGTSGLQYLGDGNWQFNWKTPKSYANQCREMHLNLADEVEDPSRTAQFQFTK